MKEGNHVSVTVVDRDGLIKEVLRVDTMGPHALMPRRREAFTSVTFKQPSGHWAKRVLTEPAIA
jgi:uncharacterized protein GlcG (DUF336 family)